MSISRSLKASQHGIEQLRLAQAEQGWTGETFAQAAAVSRSTVINFLAGKAVQRKHFIRLCELLDLKWELIADIPVDELKLLSSKNVDSLVQVLRDKGNADILKRCGMMRVLDMTYPIDASVVYTDVNVLEKVTSKTRTEIAQLMQGFTSESFDRFFFGSKRQARIDGLEAIERHNLLMILGRPGAGKTTFLKRLAMMCSLGERFADRVPIFVSLKEFAENFYNPSLLEFIGNLEAMQKVLAAGRGFVLLDGLDEVQEAEHDRVLTEIRNFARQFDQNIIIITCRIAAWEYIFEQFTQVEIADFNNEQIKDFVTKWFQLKNPQQASLFIERLEESEPLKELAASPLLLTLLCLEFEEASSFPTSRAELYQRGLNVLLTKWDGQRSIKRDAVYEKLSTKRKESLLGQLAWHTFERGDYFFKQALAERRIGEYIKNLPDASTDTEALLVDSHAVLKSIESQHGLLAERATGIYSFSHLTFHEYFVAKHVVEHFERETMLSQLLKHVTDKRWCEVFLLTTEQLEPADALLQGLKAKTDEILQADEQLQNYLVWVQAKCVSVHSNYKLAAISAYYFNLALALDRSLSRGRSIAFDFSLARALDHALDRFPSLSNSLTLDPLFNIDLALDKTLICALASTSRRFLALACGYDIDPDLKHQLLELYDALPDTSGDNRHHFSDWWKSNGQEWTDRLRNVMIRHRNLGHDWKFTKEQTQKLQQYYMANKLLVDCLNSECYVNRLVREEIEETLFLPIAEIEKWKREHRT